MPDLEGTVLASTNGLPQGVNAPLAEALVRTLDADELARAFTAATAGLLKEIREGDAQLADRLADTLNALTNPAR